MKIVQLYILGLTIFSLCLAIAPAIIEYESLKPHRGDEIYPDVGGIPYLGGRQSPGDSIGITWYDEQSNQTHGQRLAVDDFNQTHINWMWQDSAQNWRQCAWNARFSDGSYYGQTMATPSWSGYVQLDVTRDADQRTVIAYHHNHGAGLFSWIDIDGGNLWGTWPMNPGSPGVPDHIWPYVAATYNGNIVLATGDSNEDILHLYVTSDEGYSWGPMGYFDSCANLSQFVRASRNSGSEKVVFIHTRFITDSVASGQLDNDIYYMISTDGGITWGPHTNATNYQPYPADSVRAYCDVNAVFDNNDNLHIAWGGRKVTDNYYNSSKIFHWDEVNDTITIVNSPSIYYSEPGGWWITIPGAGLPGAYKMPADRPELIVDPLSNDLFCLWQGNDDYNDFSEDSIFNREIFGARSTDNGITWQIISI